MRLNNLIFQKELENRIGYRILKVLFILFSLFIVFTLVVIHDDDVLSLIDGIKSWILLLIVYKVLIYILYGKKPETK